MTLVSIAKTGIFLALLSFSSRAATVQAQSPQRETVLDRLVHTDGALQTEIPEVSPWCDELDLERYRVEVNGAELFVEEQGAGVPMVLLHGGPGGTHHYFHPWFSRAASFARVIYYDQRGTGRSDWDSGAAPYSVEQAIRDLDGLRDSLGIRKWVVLGHSYGGFLAQLYAAHYPEHVAGLVLVAADPAVPGAGLPGRESSFLTDQERARIAQVGEAVSDWAAGEDVPAADQTAITIFNRQLNGDWKRQSFYRPTTLEIARKAWYEWAPAPSFRSEIANSKEKWDLTGVFEHYPAPTLVLEGRNDLTWKAEKVDRLRANHPSAQWHWLDRAAHSPFADQPEDFFAVLESFVRTLRPPSDYEIAEYERHFQAWDSVRRATPEYLARSGLGRAATAAIFQRFNPEWIADVTGFWELLSIGQALYDHRAYADALQIFQRLEALNKEDDAEELRAVALVWQGHMLDLLGERAQAIRTYSRVAEMHLDDQWNFDQFGLVIRLSEYAAERMAAPFHRLENSWP